MSVDPTLTRLSAENPWPGLESFGEGDSEYFHGRDTEIAELFRLVRRELLTVLFGQSGLGKTSLLGAGLFPLLRKEGFVPVYLRIDFEAPAPRAQVLEGLLAECRRRNFEAPQPSGTETLWEYFHRADADFWNEKNRPVTPVLVFDQFEEAFTKGLQSEHEQHRSRCREFLAELGDLIENRPPGHLSEALDADPDVAQRFDFNNPALKLVLSFREDYLAHFEGLKRQIPSLTYNRFRLQAMNGQQAHEVVIHGGGHLVDEEVAARIIGIAAGRAAAEPAPDPAEYGDLSIDPALLSVICSELNNRRQRAGQSRITTDLISGAEKSILSDFYERCMQGLDPRVRIFVEDELLTDKGDRRDSYAFDDALGLPGVTQPAIDALIAGRLLRVDERSGLRRLELTHDVLTGVARDSRDSRKAREAEAAAEVREREAARKQRRNRIVSVLLGLGALLVVGAAAYVYWLQGQVDIAQATAVAAQATAEARLHEAQQAERKAQQAQEMAEQAQQEAEQAQEKATEARAEATKQEQRARQLGRQNDSTQLLTQARRLQDTQYDLALLLNVEASRLDQSLDVRAGFVNRFVLRPQLDGFLFGKAALNGVSYSPDGTLLAVGSADNSVVLWDARTRKPLSALAGHKGTVYDVAFSPDGRTLASASEDGTVIVWDLSAHKARTVLKGNGPVSNVAFSPDGKALAAVNRSGSVTVWEAASHRLLATLESKSGPALDVAFSPDAKLLAVASGSTVVLWDVARNLPLATLEGHQDRVLGIAFNPDGRTLASASGDKTVILWDVELRRPRGVPLAGHSRKVWSVAFGPDGTTLASASEDRTVILWDVARRERLATLEGHRDEVLSAAFSPDGKMLASASTDASVILWSLQGRQTQSALQQYSSAVLGVAFSPDGKTLAAAGEDARLTLRDMATGRADTVQGHKDRVLAVVFSPDGKTLASASEDKTVILWEALRRQPLATLEGHQDTVNGISFSPDGKMLASASRDGTVIVWDVARRRPLATLAGQHGWVWAVAFHPDGKTLASAHEDNTVILWDVAARQPRGTLKGHDKRVVSVAFSPDGRTLASASDDKAIVLWDVAGRKPLARLEKHTDVVRAVAFNREGDVLASAGGDKTVILWDAALHKPLVTLDGHRSWVRAVAFSPGGKTLVSGSDDKTTILWKWDLKALEAQACRVANRNLNEIEWRQYMGGAPYRGTCAAPPARG